MSLHNFLGINYVSCTCNHFELNTDYLMSCSTGVLLLHALQQLYNST